MSHRVSSSTDSSHRLQHYLISANLPFQPKLRLILSTVLSEYFSCVSLQQTASNYRGTTQWRLKVFLINLLFTKITNDDDDAIKCRRWTSVKQYTTRETEREIITSSSTVNSSVDVIIMMITMTTGLQPAGRHASPQITSGVEFIITWAGREKVAIFWQTAAIYWQRRLSVLKTTLLPPKFSQNGGFSAPSFVFLEERALPTPRHHSSCCCCCSVNKRTTL